MYSAYTFSSRKRKIRVLDIELSDSKFFLVCTLYEGHFLKCNEKLSIFTKNCYKYIFSVCVYTFWVEGVE